MGVARKEEKRKLLVKTNGERNRALFWEKDDKNNGDLRVLFDKGFRVTNVIRMIRYLLDQE